MVTGTLKVTGCHRAGDVRIAALGDSWGRRLKVDKIARAATQAYVPSAI
jgi:hypothetical protein